MNSRVIFFLIVVLSFKSTQTLENIDDIGYRIVGGYEAQLGDIPYIVSVERYNLHICGATILSPLMVLSAAHCFHLGLIQINDLSIRAGTVTKGSGGQVRGLRKILIHPQYNATNTDYDAAVGLLQSKLYFSAYVKSIAIPDKNYEIPPNRLGRVSGWGHLREGAMSYPKHLQTLEVSVISNEECERIYKHSKERLTTQMFCAGNKQKDACEGDSGGPFVLDFMIVGITSWGMRCADPIFPGVYTNVARVSDWIREMMSTNFK